MAASCRFAFAVHILAVLASKNARANSDALAGSVNTNPVVIRRVLARLKKAGFVKTQKGAAGGAALAHTPEAIALDSIYRAVEPRAAVSSHPQKPNRRCPVGAGIERVLGEVFAAAEAAREAELARHTLRDVLAAIAAPAPAAGRARGSSEVARSRKSQPARANARRSA